MVRGTFDECGFTSVSQLLEPKSSVLLGRYSAALQRPLRCPVSRQLRAASARTTSLCSPGARSPAPPPADDGGGLSHHLGTPGPQPYRENSCRRIPQGNRSGRKHLALTAIFCRDPCLAACGPVSTHHAVTSGGNMGGVDIRGTFDSNRTVDVRRPASSRRFHRAHPIQVHLAGAAAFSLYGRPDPGGAGRQGPGRDRRDRRSGSPERRAGPPICRCDRPQPADQQATGVDTSLCRFVRDRLRSDYSFFGRDHVHLLCIQCVRHRSRPWTSPRR
jgi:hypothetical protein